MNNLIVSKLLHKESFQLYTTVFVSTAMHLELKFNFIVGCTAYIAYLQQNKVRRKYKVILSLLSCFILTIAYRSLLGTGRLYGCLDVWKFVSFTDNVVIPLIFLFLTPISATCKGRQASKIVQYIDNWGNMGVGNKLQKILMKEFEDFRHPVIPNIRHLSVELRKPSSRLKYSPEVLTSRVKEWQLFCIKSEMSMVASSIG